MSATVDDRVLDLLDEIAEVGSVNARTRGRKAILDMVATEDWRWDMVDIFRSDSITRLMARVLGVSMGTVRTAIRRLESRGLVKVWLTDGQTSTRGDWTRGDDGSNFIVRLMLTVTAQDGMDWDGDDGRWVAE